MLYNYKNTQIKLYIFFFILVLVFTQFSTNKVLAKTYKVENIEITEPYDLDFNKEKVIDKAFKRAFNLLVARLTNSVDKNSLNNIRIDNIKKLINSFSIVEEQFFNKKYYAKFDVNFDKKSVLIFFENHSVLSSIPKQKKLFFLPIIVDIERNEISLFTKNLFYKLWNLDIKEYHLLQYVLPNEDLEDIKILQSKINDIEDYNFSEIILKYNLKDYIVCIFFLDKDKTRVLSKIKLENDNIILNKEFGFIKLNNANSIQPIIDNLKIIYEDRWKKINQINTNIKLPITLSIDSKNIELINKFEKKLLNIDLISEYNIDKFSSANTIYKIIYNGTPDKFLTHFRDIGFEVDTSYRIWKIK